MLEYIWVGKNESDVLQNDIFLYSITLFGSNKNNNYSFFENYKTRSFDYYSFISFIAEKSELIIKHNNTCKLYFYNPTWAYDVIRVDENLIDYMASELIPSKTLDFLNNKAMSRLWISNIIKIPPFVLLSKSECSYENIKSLFENYDTFIVQQNVSEGGEGTHILKKDTPIMNVLNESETFLAAPFFEKSISLNVTLLINNDGEYISCPISLQVFDDKNNYIGSDFIAGNYVYQTHKNSIDNFIIKIAKILMEISYIGICGIDFIIHNDELYFIEFNPRFQGSSFLINIWLKEMIDISLYELNLMCFNCTSFLEIKQIINDKRIPQSYLIYDSKSIQHNFLNNHTAEKIITDGTNILFQRAVFNEQITDVHYEYTSNDYYNYFATKYKYILPDYEKMIESQGDILSNIFEKFSEISVSKVLDCTCGIGVQTISLAKKSYIVYGSDISQKELDVAEKESKRLGLDINYYLADCRDLQSVFKDKFDAIISMDSALPHLLTESNFRLAFNSIYMQLNKGGVFLASFRDYENMIQNQTLWAYPPRYKKTEKKDIVVVRYFEWNDDICESHQYYIENDKNSFPKLYYNKYKQWAITKDKILNIIEGVPFSKCFWLLPSDTKFYQPILCAIK